MHFLTFSPNLPRPFESPHESCFVMRPSFLALSFLALCLASGCTSQTWKNAFSAQVVTVSYDDLGPESFVAPLLGPRGGNPQVVAHAGATRADTEPRRLNAHQGLLLLRKNARQLPATPAGAALRQRMDVAYARLLHFYNARRAAFTSVPPFGGRGSMTMARMTTMPPMPPTL